MDSVNRDAEAREAWRGYFQEPSSDIAVKRYVALLTMAGAVVVCMVALLGPVIGNIMLNAR